MKSLKKYSSIFSIKNFLKRITPNCLIDFYHFSLSFLGAFFYNFPSRKISIIGVTGTNGKSSVIEMTSSILREGGVRTASISSIHFRIGEKQWVNNLKMTMPGRFQLQKFLRKAVQEKCSHALIEVTSEGIKQHRHNFINFKTAVFTNLTPEHIESHGSFKKYRNAKGKLFKTLKGVSIINLDDKNKDYFLKFPSKEKYGYGINFKGESNFKTIKAENIEILSSGINFKIKDVDFNLKLKGLFNVYNCLASICVGLSQKMSLEECKKGLEKLENIPGRVEIVLEKPFMVIVDYAHTPDALESLYKTALKLKKGGKIIGILGSCGGGRDRWKRPELGKIASSYCDNIILTNEDPYDESPMGILKDIEKGITLKKDKIYEIIDRRDAIKKGLSLASFGDVVVVSGKGCEPWMCVKDGKKIPWDDRKIAKEELRTVFSKK